MIFRQFSNDALTVILPMDETVFRVYQSPALTRYVLE